MAEIGPLAQIHKEQREPLPLVLHPLVPPLVFVPPPLLAWIPRTRSDDSSPSAPPFLVALSGADSGADEIAHPAPPIAPPAR